MGTTFETYLAIWTSLCGFATWIGYWDSHRLFLCYNNGPPYSLKLPGWFAYLLYSCSLLLLTNLLCLQVHWTCITPQTLSHSSPHLRDASLAGPLIYSRTQRVGLIKGRHLVRPFLTYLKPQTHTLVPLGHWAFTRTGWLDKAPRGKSSQQSRPPLGSPRPPCYQYICIRRTVTNEVTAATTNKLLGRRYSLLPNS